MQHIITDEEENRFWEVYCKSPGSGRDSRKAALADFLNNRPESTLGKLRPIAEMPETVPEGCSIQFCHFTAARPIVATSPDRQPTDNFFFLVQLPTPDPEAEERQRFEEAFKQVIHEPDLRRREDTYEDDETADFWALWKLAKAK